MTRDKDTLAMYSVKSDSVITVSEVRNLQFKILNLEVADGTAVVLDDQIGVPPEERRIAFEGKFYPSPFIHALGTGLSEKPIKRSASVNSPKTLPMVI